MFCFQGSLGRVPRLTSPVYIKYPPRHKHIRNSYTVAGTKICYHSLLEAVKCFLMFFDFDNVFSKIINTALKKRPHGRLFVCCYQFVNYFSFLIP